MVYVKNVIGEMFQKTYVVRDLNENRPVIRDRDPLPFTTLHIWFEEPPPNTERPQSA